MEEEFNFESLQKAGQITKEARDFGQTLVIKGAKIGDIVDAIQNKIFELGGQIAFPVNISLNETAAHDSATINDERILNDEIVKLDVGVHVDGWIGDSACTVDLSGKHKELVNASREALNNALSIIKKGTTLGQIGAIIEKTIVDKGFQPIRNLAGHQIGRYVLHTGTTVPNYDNGDDTELEPGTTFAIEPFATTGIGLIEEKGHPEIHSIEEFKPARLPMVRKILDYIYKENLFLPFSNRMLSSKFSEAQIKIALQTIRNTGGLKSYKPLVEKSGGMVSQAEHTVYIDEDWKVHILTK